MLWLILVFICVFGVYVYTRINRVRRYADKLPGEVPWPILGSALEVGTDPVGNKLFKFIRNIFVYYYLISILNKCVILIFYIKIFNFNIYYLI